MPNTPDALLNSLHSMGLSRSYTIAFSLRCGSTVLSNILSHLGLGLPTEYFQYPYTSNSYFADLTGLPVEQFSTLVLKHARGGIFGSKMTHDHRAHLDGKLRHAIAGYRTLDDILPRHQWIYIHRNDKIAQAVSWHVAEITRQWHISSHDVSFKGHAGVRYDFFSILSKVMILGANQANWEAYFAQNGVRPLRLVYEDLLDDPAQQLSLIVAGLDMEKNTFDINLERDGGLKSISSHSSETYAVLMERFREDFLKLGQSNDRERLGPNLDRWNRFFFEQQWQS